MTPPSATATMTHLALPPEPQAEQHIGYLKLKHHNPLQRISYGDMKTPREIIPWATSASAVRRHQDLFTDEHQLFVVTGHRLDSDLYLTGIRPATPREQDEDTTTRKALAAASTTKYSPALPPDFPIDPPVDGEQILIGPGAFDEAIKDHRQRLAAIFATVTDYTPTPAMSLREATARCPHAALLRWKDMAWQVIFGGDICASIDAWLPGNRPVTSTAAQQWGSWVLGTGTPWTALHPGHSYVTRCTSAPQP